MRKKFMKELVALGLPAKPDPDIDLRAITEADLAPIPDAARRYLRFMRVVDRPRD